MFVGMSDALDAMILVRRRGNCFTSCMFWLLALPEQTYQSAMKDMPWKGIVHSNATVANLIRKAEIRVLPAVIVVDDKVGVSCCTTYREYYFC